MSSTENILVSVRVKPSREGSVWKCHENNTITGKHKRNETFALDKVFSPLNNTQDIYDSVVKKNVKSAVKGYHGSIMVFGQTNSGKTFTMLGTKRQPGIIPKVAEGLFRYIRDEHKRDFLIRVSYFEVYNEIVNDLLGTGSNLKIIKDKRGQIQIQGVTETDIIDQDQVINVIERGQRNRKIASNNFNEQSSRSHTIFRIIIESQNNDGSTARTAFLHLVDLAGSEAVGRNKLSGTRASEGRFINKSLLSLQRIITMLSGNNKGTHIPYRDSKLTRILENSLGGNSRVSIICTIAPEMANVEESFSTLRFATNAKKIRSEVKVNESLSKGQVLQHYKDKVDELQKVIEDLKKRSEMSSEMNSEMNSEKSSETSSPRESQALTGEQLNELLGEEEENKEEKEGLMKQVELANKLAEKFEAEIHANQRQINQLSSLIIQSDMIQDKEERRKEIEDSSDFGLFKVSVAEPVPPRRRENSILNVLSDKDTKIKTLEAKVVELELMLEETMGMLEKGTGDN